MTGTLAQSSHSIPRRWSSLRESRWGRFVGLGLEALKKERSRQVIPICLHLLISFPLISAVLHFVFRLGRPSPSISSSKSGPAASAGSFPHFQESVHIVLWWLRASCAIGRRGAAGRH